VYGLGELDRRGYIGVKIALVVAGSHCAAIRSPYPLATHSEDTCISVQTYERNEDEDRPPSICCVDSANILKQSP
jgi:hypothetical protein